jgi:DNA transformation protein
MSLTSLTNIGPTIAEKLTNIGIRNRKALQKMGPVKAYLKMARKAHPHHLPVCYYLLSLEGALTDTDWRKIPQSQKEKLLKQLESLRNKKT